MTKKFLQVEVEKLNQEFEKESPQKILSWAFEIFSNRVALANSLSAEDMVLTDMFLKISPSVRIFCLDTGRLNPETYNVMEKVKAKYNYQIELYFPEAEEVEKMVKDFGINLFYRSVEERKLCCKVRKINPLKRVLSTVDCWITGLRREQSVTRSDLLKAEIDNGNGGILKLNPLADWSEKKTWDYVRENNVPYNILHDMKYPSIGCAPCTRAIKEGEDVRAGRWWWEKPEHKECGLHLKTG